ncbi:MAG: YcjF family protein [Crocosphaera sp.]
MMRVKVKKPILVAGLGISFLLWLGESLHEQAIAMGEWGVLSLMAVGTGVWWWQKKQPQKPVYKTLSPLTITEVNQAISEGQKILKIVKQEDSNYNLSELETRWKDLPQKLNNQSVSLGIISNSNTEKNSLKQLLQHEKIADNFQYLDAENSENVKQKLDLIVFLINTDLTESQWQMIQKCHQNHQRCLISLNQSEKYNSEEQEIILQEIKQRVKTIIQSDDIIGINTSPKIIKVRQYKEDKSYQEWNETQPSNILDLTTRLNSILNQEREQLILGKVWREAQEIKQQLKVILNKIRRDRAVPMMEKYQWIAAAAAFANPVSSLDLLATAAINAQMIVDLSNIYQQKFTLSQGQTIAATIGKLMIKLGLVELSTHAISSLLKSNAITYVAGGATQGISAAYLTRVAGLSLVEYFQEQEINPNQNQSLDIEKLSTKIKQVFEQTKRTEILQGFVKQTIPQLS